MVSYEKIIEKPFSFQMETSWFELHKSQDERLSTPSSVVISLKVTFLLCQTVRSGSVMITVVL